MAKRIPFFNNAGVKLALPLVSKLNSLIKAIGGLPLLDRNNLAKIYSIVEYFRDLMYTQNYR